MKKENNIKKILRDIDVYSKLIKESYVFDEDDTQEYEEPIEDEADMGGGAEEKINQIRALALDGIQEYAEEVDSDEYIMFKNIWMTCDKFYSAKNKETEEK